jgi:hypothetical protein
MGRCLSGSTIDLSETSRRSTVWKSVNQRDLCHRSITSHRTGITAMASVPSTTSTWQRLVLASTIFFLVGSVLFPPVKSTSGGPEQRRTFLFDPSYRERKADPAVTWVLGANRVCKEVVSVNVIERTIPFDLDYSRWAGEMALTLAWAVLWSIRLRRVRTHATLRDCSRESDFCRWMAEGVRIH